MLRTFFKHLLPSALPCCWALFVAAASAQAATPQLADCNGPAGHQILLAAPPQAAQAVWLDAQRLLWPGRAADGRYRLHHSERAVIDASVGQPVRGAQGSVALVPALNTARPLQASAFAAGPVLMAEPTTAPDWRALHRGMLTLVQEDANGGVLASTAVQMPMALDALYTAAEDIPDLGVQITRGRSHFKLWAPTAQQVQLCLYTNASAGATQLLPLQRDERTGAWQRSIERDLSGGSYRYLVDVFVRGSGWVRQLVTDPYSVSLSTDSQRSLIADLRSPALAPAGWAAHRSTHAKAARRAPQPTDMVIYELHVRDFSVGDTTVRPGYRGKYLAFTEPRSNGMKHLRALSAAGLTDIHLLPVFDIATIPEAGCSSLRVNAAAPDSAAQQAQVMAGANSDCFNWGYDPFHFNAPEGSYATNAEDGKRRVLEFRRMVMALHQAGLRVGMDVVYNHTAASGLHIKAVLDRVVPGYYQRLNNEGGVENSTCCDNTATEHRMMGKLMLDSLLLWARHYGIDSFRFDLMGHQPRALMVRAQALLKKELGRDIHFIGEGWNFGEVAGGARFQQASQRELNGTGIGTFSDRGRDAVRGGAHDDSAEKLISRQGWLNGLHHQRNALAPESTLTELKQAADKVRVGLAGTLQSYAFVTHDGSSKTLAQIDYHGQPAGYASEPSEVVNYVDNHDNQTLFDINAMRLPQDSSREDRARVQLLGAAITAFSQGVAYFHAGIDTLRSKSLDRNSYDSGDWFNQLDWTYQDNHFGIGLPPERDNGPSWAVMRPILANALIKPGPREIAWMRDGFRDLLQIRASSPLFRLRTAQAVNQRLQFHNVGTAQTPTVLVGHLDGRGLPLATHRELLYFISVDNAEQRIKLPALTGRRWVLHPVHLAAAAADKRPAAVARWDASEAAFVVPARTAVVFVAQ
jgi:pullulanase